MAAAPSRVCAAILIAGTIVATSPAAEPRVDRFGDPLPVGAVMRLGTIGFRVPRASGVGFRSTGELVAVTETMDIYVWPGDGTSKPTLSKLNKAPYASRGPVISPDARFAAAQVGRRLIVWDLSGKEPAEYFSRDTDNIQKLCFSPDGARLVVQADGERLGTLHLCDLKAKSWDELPFRGRYAESLSFTHDGKSLVVLERQNISVIDVATRKERCLVQCPGFRPAFAALSPDGSVLAVQPTGFIRGPEPKVRLLSLPDGKEVAKLKPPTGPARWVEFSPGGSTLLLGSQHGIREWNPRAGRLEREIPGPAEHPPVFSADGHRFATHGSNAVLLVDATSGKPVRPNLMDAGHTAILMGISVSPDGKRIATLGGDSEIRVWAADTGLPLCRVPAPSGNDRRIAFMPDSQSFITVAEDFVTPVMYDATTGRELRRFTVPPDVVKKEVTRDLRLSADGKTLITSSIPVVVSRAGSTVSWDIATGRPVGRTDTPDLMMLELDGGSHSPDGRWMIRHGTATRVGTSDSIQIVPATESGMFAWPIFTADSRLVTVWRTVRVGKEIDWNGGSIVIFDLSARSKISEPPAGRPVRQALSPDGRRLAVGSTDRAAVWDVASGTLLRRFPANGKGAWTNAVAFSPDGRRLITGHDDCSALVWELPPQNTAPLAGGECAAAWADLAAADAGKGFAAVCRMADDPKQSLPLLTEHLRPVVAPPSGEIRALLTDLASPQFKTRDAAEKALRSHGDRIESLLRDALKANPPAEAKKRIEAILAGLDAATPPEGEVLRGARAVWVLERIGTPDARHHLEKLATGVEAARLTREAKAALERSKN